MRAVRSTQEGLLQRPWEAMPEVHHRSSTVLPAQG